MPTTILLCTDGSDTSVEALAAGVALLRPPDRYVVVTVVDADDPSVLFGPAGEVSEPIVGPEQFAQERRQNRAWADELVERVAAQLGLAGADTRVVEGRAGPTLCAVADELQAAAMVLGSRGRGGLKRAVLGSVSDHVVRHAPCTVVVTGRRA